MRLDTKKNSVVMISCGRTKSCSIVPSPVFNFLSKIPLGRQSRQNYPYPSSEGFTIHIKFMSDLGVKQ